jgi:hypothetical protein
MKTKKQEIIENYGEEILIMDGYDDCIIGVVEQFGRPPIVCYNRELVIRKLMDEGMSEEESIEFFEYNQIGAWVGDYTPCFITLL